MTASQHQAAAKAEEHAAASHGREYDPAKAGTVGPTGPSMGSYAACVSYESSNCYVRWQSEENPTNQHRKRAEHHKKLADKHRSASKMLVEAEQRFCSGIPEADRDLSPFYRREDITAAYGIKKPEAAYASQVAPKVVNISQIEKEVLGTMLLGARITFRAVPGMTGEWLQRVVDCHLARNAVVGGSDMPNCPLAVPHASATVTSTGNGFAVDIISYEAESALDILYPFDEHRR